MIPLSVHLEGIVCPEDLLALGDGAPVGEGLGEVDGLHVVPDQRLGLGVGAERAGVQVPGRGGDELLQVLRG